MATTRTPDCGRPHPQPICLCQACREARPAARTSKNSGRSTTGGPKTPYFPGDGFMEAAKHLHRTVGRLLRSTASAADVESAIRIWHAALDEARLREEKESRHGR